MKLYSYFRSSAAFRVRIALELKSIPHQTSFVHLAREGGEQNAPSYLDINPQGRVPCLELDNGSVLIQSPAILEYLEEVCPKPALLPTDPAMRARIRGVAALIGCDIHPLHNVGPLNYLRRTLGAEEPEVSAWIRHWMSAGLEAVEHLIGDTGWCFGPEPSLADVYLVPQVFAARRFEVDLTAMPRIGRVEREAQQHRAFIDASPPNQPDAE